MKNNNIADIFPSKSLPKYTYIERRVFGKETYETQLKQALFTSGKLIFILGAYKSGKTCLYRQVIPTSRLINISGNDIACESDLWDQIADKAGISSQAERNTSNTNIPINTIVKHLNKNNKILVIDDFHCINNNLQVPIIKILKNELQRGLRTIIVSVLHKIDYILDSIPFSSTTINLMPWKSKELEQIAQKGLELVDTTINDYVITMLARESVACPQLMQENCYKLIMLCQERDISEVTDETARIIIPYMKDIKLSETTK